MLLANDLKYNSIESAIKQYLHTPQGIIDIEYTSVGVNVNISKVVAFVPYKFKKNDYSEILEENMDGMFLCEASFNGVININQSIYIEVYFENITHAFENKMKCRITTNPIIEDRFLKIGVLKLKYGTLAETYIDFDFYAFQESNYYNQFYNGNTFNLFDYNPMVLIKEQNSIYENSAFNIKIAQNSKSILSIGNRKINGKIIGISDNDKSLAIIKIKKNQDLTQQLSLKVKTVLMQELSPFLKYFNSKESANLFYYEFENGDDLKGIEVIFNNISNTEIIIDEIELNITAEILKTSENEYLINFNDDEIVNFENSSISIFMNLLLTADGIKRDFRNLFLQDLKYFNKIYHSEKYNDGFCPVLFSDIQMKNIFISTPIRLQGFDFNDVANDGKLHNGFPVIAFFLKKINSNDIINDIFSLLGLQSSFSLYSLKNTEITNISDYLVSGKISSFEDTNKDFPSVNNMTLNKEYKSKFITNTYTIDRVTGVVNLFPMSNDYFNQNYNNFIKYELFSYFIEVAEIDDIMLSSKSDINNKNLCYLKVK